MINLTDFVPDVQAAATSCPGFAVEKAVIATAIEFAKMSWAIQEEHDAFDLEEGVSEYELDNPASSIITGIINVRIDGEPIDGASVAAKDCESDSWRTETASLPTYFLRDMSGSIKKLKLYPIPTADVSETVETLMAIAPARSATRIDDAFGDEHYEAIIAGATARVLLLPNKLWAEPNLARGYRQTFLEYAHSARNRVIRDTMRVQNNLKAF